MIDPADLIEFATWWSDLGTAIQDQLLRVLDGDHEDINPNAIREAQRSLDRLIGYSFPSEMEEPLTDIRVALEDALDDIEDNEREASKLRVFRAGREIEGAPESGDVVVNGLGAVFTWVSDGRSVKEGSFDPDVAPVVAAELSRLATPVLSSTACCPACGSDQVLDTEPGVYTCWDCEEVFDSERALDL